MADAPKSKSTDSSTSASSPAQESTPARADVSQKPSTQGPGAQSPERTSMADAAGKNIAEAQNNPFGTVTTSDFVTVTTIPDTMGAASPNDNNQNFQFNFRADSITGSRSTTDRGAKAVHVSQRPNVTAKSAPATTDATSKNESPAASDASTSNSPASGTSVESAGAPQATSDSATSSTNVEAGSGANSTAGSRSADGKADVASARDGDEANANRQSNAGGKENTPKVDGAARTSEDGKSGGQGRSGGGENRSVAQSSSENAAITKTPGNSGLNLLSDMMRADADKKAQGHADDPLFQANVHEEEVRDFNNLTHGDFEKKHGWQRYNYVKEFVRTLPAPVLERIWGVNAQSDGPAFEPPRLARDQERQQQIERDKQERRKNNPNAYDRAQGDLENLRRATDPAGAGALKAGTEGMLRAGGVSKETAEKVAIGVDTTFGVAGALAGKGNASREIVPPRPPTGFGRPSATAVGRGTVAKDSAARPAVPLTMPKVEIRAETVTANNNAQGWARTGTGGWERVDVTVASRGGSSRGSSGPQVHEGPPGRGNSGSSTQEGRGRGSSGTRDGPAPGRGTTLEAQRRAPVGRFVPPIGAIKVFRPQQQGESLVEYGQRIHQHGLPEFMAMKYPGATYTLNVRPGVTGPDVVPSAGYNAVAGELKPIGTPLGQLEVQIQGWGHEMNQTRLIFYDRTGLMVEGMIDRPPD
jgi:hypothetical protein